MSGSPRVLVITAMLPSAALPLRGIVVERELATLRAAGLEVDVVTKRPGPWGYVGQLREARAAVRRLRPTVVHAHFGTSGLVAAALGGGHRLVVTLHGSDVAYGPRFVFSKHWLQYWMSVLAAWRADVVIVQAGFMCSRLPRRLRGRVVVLPQAIDSAFPAPVVERDPRSLLFLADARRPVKRAALARAAVLEVADLHLELRTLDEIPPERIPDAMARARMGLLTSLSEGLPVACREALLSGLPLVAVDLPGTRELAAAVPGGVELVSHDPRAIAKGLRTLAEATAGAGGAVLSAELRQHTGSLGWDQAEHLDRLLECYGVVRHGG